MQKYLNYSNYYKNQICFVLLNIVRLLCTMYWILNYLYYNKNNKSFGYWVCEWYRTSFHWQKRKSYLLCLRISARSGSWRFCLSLKIAPIFSIASSLVVAAAICPQVNASCRGVSKHWTNVAAIHRLVDFRCLSYPGLEPLAVRCVWARPSVLLAVEIDQPRYVSNMRRTAAQHSRAPLVYPTPIWRLTIVAGDRCRSYSTCYENPDCVNNIIAVVIEMRYIYMIHCRVSLSSGPTLSATRWICVWLSDWIKVLL